MRVFLLTIGFLAACVDAHRPPMTDGGGGDDCEAVEHDVTVRGDSDVADLPKGCWDLYGKLSVNGSSITSLAMLGDIRSANDIEIMNTSLTGFDTKSPVDVWYGEITVISNSKLTDLKNLTIHDGHVASVRFDTNAQLATFELTGLNKVDGDVAVTNNPMLTAVTLKDVTSIGGEVAITNNAALKTINLGAPTTVNRFEVSSNPVLTSIAGAPSQQVLGDFIIRGNKALTSITGLGGLNRIRGTLTIDNNAALTSLSAFPTTALTIESPLIITNNGLLTDLGGLSHAFYIYTVNITGNGSLAYCTAWEVPTCVSQRPASWNVANNKNTTTNCNFWCN